MKSFEKIAKVVKKKMDKSPQVLTEYQYGQFDQGGGKFPAFSPAVAEGSYGY